MDVAYTLITDEEVLELPFTVEGFVQYERICRNRFNEHSGDLRNNDLSQDELRMSYMSHVSNAAKEFELEDASLLDMDYFVRPGNGNNFSQGEELDFDKFDRTVHGLLSKYQLQVARKKQLEQFALSDTDKTKIRHYIERLRDLIEKSNLDGKKKEALYVKLNELQAQLHGKKFDLGKAMVIITTALAIVSTAEADAIKLPKAVAAIGQVIGLAKNYYDSIAPTVKQIEHKPEAPTTGGFKPVVRQPTGPRVSFSADLDDEIPF